MMKTILVTGAAGFLGSHLCEALLEAGETVIGVDNFVTGDAANLESFKDHERFTFVEADVNELLSYEGDVDQIYHLACPASPVDYQKLPLETLRVSAEGTWNVLELAREKGARFLFTSTSEVYGDPEEHPQKESYWGHVNPIGPRSCYDEGKRFAESLVVNYGMQHGVDWKIVRIFNTYGPRMRKADGRVIPNFIQQALANEPLTLYGEGEQTRSFCYVSDMVEGLIAMMAKDDFSGPVNLGNPEEFSIKTLAEQIVEIMESSSQLTHEPLPENDPQRRCPDITLAQQALDFSPQVSLKEGLIQTIDSFKL